MLLEQIQENLTRQQVQLNHLIEITEDLEDKIWKGERSLTHDSQEHKARLVELEKNQDTILKVSWSVITTIIIALTAFAWNTIQNSNEDNRNKEVNSSRLLKSSDFLG